MRQPSGRKGSAGLFTESYHVRCRTEGRVSAFGASVFTAAQEAAAQCARSYGRDTIEGDGMGQATLPGSRPKKKRQPEGAPSLPGAEGEYWSVKQETKFYQYLKVRWAGMCVKRLEFVPVGARRHNSAKERNSWFEKTSRGRGPPRWTRS